MEEKSVERVESVVEGVVERPVVRWACPVCSDPWGGDFAGEEVVLERVEAELWSCPRCGRVSASPEDDGAWEV